MKHLICIAIIFIFAGRAFPQMYVAMVKKGGKWGFVNSKNELIIPPQFFKANSFTADGFAPVYNLEKDVFYFVNLKGQRLYTKYPSMKLLDHFNVDLQGFNNGLAPVKLGDKWAYMAPDGHLATPIIYDEAFEFSEGCGYAKIDGKFFIIDINGKAIPVEDPDTKQVRNFSEGLAPYSARHNSFGFIGQDGKIVIKAQYENVGYFKDSLAWARLDDGRVGYINQKGEWVIKPRFKAGRDFDGVSGLARVSDDGYWVYVNLKGDLMDVKDTFLFGDFSEGLAMGRKDTFIGFYNNKGEWVIPPKFDGARDFKNGFASVKQFGKWGVIAKDGRWVIPPSFAAIKDMELVPDH